MTRNTMSRKELRVLEDLVTSHAGEIKAGRWTLKCFADFASRRMGRQVTEANVRGASNTVEVQFPSNKPMAGRNLKELRAAVELLAGELVGLKGRLGEVVSPTLQGLAAGLGEPESSDRPETE